MAGLLLFGWIGDTVARDGCRFATHPGPGDVLAVATAVVVAAPAAGEFEDGVDLAKFDVGDEREMIAAAVARETLQRPPGPRPKIWSICECGCGPGHVRPLASECQPGQEQAKQRSPAVEVAGEEDRPGGIERLDERADAPVLAKRNRG